MKTWPYHPNCGTCPFQPRAGYCSKARPQDFFYTLSFKTKEDGSVGLQKLYFTGCSVSPDPIPVDPKDLPDEILKKIPLRIPEDED